MTGQIFSDGFEDGTTNARSMTSHTNGIHDVHWMDGSSMQRPARIRARRSGGGFSYEWRPTGELRCRTGNGLNKWFAYDAGGERVVVHDRLGDTLTFTIRDLDGKVLRVFERDALGSWSWEKDYVYRNGFLLASKDPAGTVHFTLDHLFPDQLHGARSADAHTNDRRSRSPGRRRLRDLRLLPGLRRPYLRVREAVRRPGICRAESRLIADEAPHDKGLG